MKKMRPNIVLKITLINKFETKLKPCLSVKHTCARFVVLVEAWFKAVQATLY